DTPFQVEDYLSELHVPEKSPLIGKTIGDVEETSEGSVTVTAIIREGHRRYTPARHWRIFADDVLMVESNPQDLQSLVQTAGVELVGPEEATTDRTGTADTIIVEAVIMAESPMIGRTGVDLRLRSRYGVSLVAVSRAGRRTTTRLAHTPFATGDV